MDSETDEDTARMAPIFHVLNVLSESTGHIPTRAKDKPMAITASDLFYLIAFGKNSKGKPIRDGGNKFEYSKSKHKMNYYIQEMLMPSIEGLDYKMPYSEVSDDPFSICVRNYIDRLKRLFELKGSISLKNPTTQKKRFTIGDSPEYQGMGYPVLTACWKQDSERGDYSKIPIRERAFRDDLCDRFLRLSFLNKYEERNRINSMEGAIELIRRELDEIDQSLSDCKYENKEKPYLKALSQYVMLILVASIVGPERYIDISNISEGRAEDWAFACNEASTLTVPQGETESAVETESEPPAPVTHIRFIRYNSSSSQFWDWIDPVSEQEGRTEYLVDISNPHDQDYELGRTHEMNEKGCYPTTAKLISLTPTYRRDYGGKRDLHEDFLRISRHEATIRVRIKDGIPHCSIILPKKEGRKKRGGILIVPNGGRDQARPILPSEQEETTYPLNLGDIVLLRFISVNSIRRYAPLPYTDNENNKIIYYAFICLGYDA